MTAAIAPRAHIANLSPYKAGGKLAYDGPVALLASNENALGPGEKAAVAMRDAAAGVHIYPDPDYGALRSAIAARHGIADGERVVLGAGSDELISLLTHAYAGPGDEVLYTAHAFSMYRVNAIAFGATPKAAPETADLHADVDALVDHAGLNTKLVYLAEPNNPTGTMVGVDAVKALRAALPAQALLVIDGAYAEFLDDGVYRALQDFAAGREDVVILRTFSKIRGLAALRLGWGYVPRAVAGVLQQLRSPFNVNGIAVAGGLASLEDDAHVQVSRAHNAEWGVWLRQRLQALDLPTPESHANFVLSQFPSVAAAADADDYLRSQGVLVRRVAGYGLPDRLRISIGLEGDLKRCVKALEEWRVGGRAPSAAAHGSALTA